MFLKRLLPFLLAACAACGSMGGGPVDRPQADARAALTGLVEDYQAPRPEPFFRRFDQSRFPNFEVYRDRVRDFQLRNRQITLDVIVDSTTGDGKDVSVTAHWNKSYVPPAGAPTLKEGRCQLVFRRESDGALLLSSISGDSPF